MKTIDYVMRQQYNFKPILKADRITKLYQEIIINEIELNKVEKQKKEAAKIHIDVSKLHKIRSNSIETQNKLIVPEDVEESTEDFEEEIEETAAPEIAISNIETEFMKCLLYGREYKEMLKDNGVILSVLVDSINENLFDLFNDTVIDFDGEKPVIIEDYIDELKGRYR